MPPRETWVVKFEESATYLTSLKWYYFKKFKEKYIIVKTLQEKSHITFIFVMLKILQMDFI